ncbi:MAG: ribose-5-phosphate isomerase B, ribose 5-phosphate isomerase B [Candidatus Woesebacteria bacterium GW2011_GWF1_31_35]|uniref:RpiB/LacA/LacB family sugar-phosphate isomerase n=1 Tax=Candidatus Woesebacteria bacterium GW2011_GWC2_31_9 TaxID=1618586 RepID=A0A0G0AYT3_9BACT|nr:MAG: ribose-5-phosphate isomerase B, ribose 5-phosphate isomerase B [Candidatus Woesebacteria bacterium GW2011_GWF1_31_35]KKP23159.1 MAG: hypothetical protein UR11_C0001G0133 [Candidatus Woesebacteria bacterium GW2011_GWC1_30_29]KKP26847.1 MAG: hypothetical protein UR13_C0002G0082 [Candidatus Woesebacteria bacterium GW2011_GWD1_31_12]KKP27421.1 MAG: hypothetical protein UR16_C0003G0081 [Candidatus Woesebacteria bacterium GW2011_GWB1_31_29]KKP31695.1 MAG: hypothetical protein UR21_C0006G0010 
MKIFTGSDHRGYLLKEKVNSWVFDLGYTFEDVGPLIIDPFDDFTKYVSEVASLVANTKGSRGVVLCGSGVGADILANKFDGIRASIGKDKNQIKKGRSDDDMNVLVLAADFTKDEEAKEMLKAFLDTKFKGKSRFKRRLKEIEKIEANN